MLDVALEVAAEKPGSLELLIVLHEQYKAWEQLPVFGKLVSSSRLYSQR